MRSITAGYRKSIPLAVGPVKGVRRGLGMTILTVHSEKKHTEYTTLQSIFYLLCVLLYMLQKMHVLLSWLQEGDIN